LGPYPVRFGVKKTNKTGDQLANLDNVGSAHLPPSKQKSKKFKPFMYADSDTDSDDDIFMSKPYYQVCNKISKEKESSPPPGPTQQDSRVILIDSQQEKSSAAPKVIRQVLKTELDSPFKDEEYFSIDELEMSAVTRDEVLSLDSAKQPIPRHLTVSANHLGLDGGPKEWKKKPSLVNRDVPPCHTFKTKMTTVFQTKTTTVTRGEVLSLKKAPQISPMLSDVSANHLGLDGGPKDCMEKQLLSKKNISSIQNFKAKISIGQLDNIPKLIKLFSSDIAYLAIADALSGVDGKRNLEEQTRIKSANTSQESSIRKKKKDSCIELLKKGAHPTLQL
jgi:hypothetical protein